MKPFIHEDFLMETKTSRKLFHDHAEHLPIIDYHCHLPPREIAENKQFENLTDIWLRGDHYKWRAMRAAGVEERFCTGDAPDFEKFKKWAETVPKTIRNPLYHWTHMELKKPFDITDRLLDSTTAKSIWDDCNAKLKTLPFFCRGLMQQAKVELVCTTDDPTDTLEYHIKIAGDPSFPIKVYPAFRPDKGMAVENPSAFNTWVDKLAQASGIAIIDFESYIAALENRHDFFHAYGCTLSDHGIEEPYGSDYTDDDIRRIFTTIRGGNELNQPDILKFKSAMMFEFGKMDAQKGWTQQLHLGALRSVNSKMFKLLGPDTGFDAIGDFTVAKSLARFLDKLCQAGKLPRTILYNLNPRDNELLAVMAGCFQGDGIAGKIQFGSGWWFLDQKDGMEKQINALSTMGILSLFVGMLTDSRSFLSYPRHDYFRRILCNILGKEIELGLIPNDIALVGNMVKDISYYNAKRYFQFA